MLQPRRRRIARTPSPRGVSSQRGFSLIEAVVALLIFATGVLGITRLQSVAVQETGTAAMRTQAALLTRNLIATMWLSDRTPANFASNFDDGSNGAGYTAFRTAVADAMPGVAGVSANAPQVTVTSMPGGAGTAVPSNQVTVVVYWQGPGDASRHRYAQTAEIK